MFLLCVCALRLSTSGGLSFGYCPTFSFCFSHSQKFHISLVPANCAHNKPRINIQQNVYFPHLSKRSTTKPLPSTLNQTLNSKTFTFHSYLHINDVFYAWVLYTHVQLCNFRKHMQETYIPTQSLWCNKLLWLNNIIDHFYSMHSLLYNWLESRGMKKAFILKSA